MASLLETINSELFKAVTSGEETGLDFMSEGSKAPQDEDREHDPMSEVGLVSMSPLIADIRSKFSESERARCVKESQWIKNVAAYRGNDNGDNFRNSEKSKVYIRTTSVKVKAAYAQITEALFSDNNFPIGVTDTPVPSGVSEYAHLKTDMEANAPVMPEEMAAPQEPIGLGFPGDGFELEAGSTGDNLKFLGGLKDEYTDEAGESPLMEGHDRTGQAPQINISSRLAKRMEKQIHDRLAENNATTETRKMIQEMCLLGTGVLKGPFNVNKVHHNWEFDEDGNSTYVPEEVKTNKVSMTSLWNIYPDPNANHPNEMEWLIERHKMNHAQLRQLRNRPHFDNLAIDRLLFTGGNYSRRSFESSLDEDYTSSSESRLFEVLEYWGYIPVELLSEYNLDVPIETLTSDFVQINAWVSGNEVLRVVVNPFIPQRIPYYIIPYEVDPYSIWGTGVPELMEDTQAMMNGFARLAVDNLALAGNLVFDVDESSLVPGQDMEISPGRILRRQAGSPGQAVHGISFPNTAPANMMMFKEFRQLADEATGIPSFAHGQMGVMSPTRTASGMSMLLSNASLNIKTVVRNIDDYGLKPLGEAMFRWEMQFNPNPEIKGDLEIKAMGSSSLQAKEIRSQRLNNFLQMAGNPALAPLIKLPTVLREFAMTMDIDPEEILNSPEEAQIYAQIIGAQNLQQPSQGPSLPGNELGAAPLPSEQGFTGNDLGGTPPQLPEGGQLNGLEGA